MERHVVLGDEFFSVGQPFVQILCGPLQFGILERGRVFERRDGTGVTAEYAAQPRPFLVPIQRVASAASLFEQHLAGLSGSLSVSGNGKDRGGGCSEQHCQTGQKRVKYTS